MPEPHDDAPPASWVTRWRHRTSSGAARWFWGILFLAGFGIWIWRVHEWAAHHGHSSWINDDLKPTYVMVAALTYWPPVIALWSMLYPADHRGLPWDDRDEEPL